MDEKAKKSNGNVASATVHNNRDDVTRSLSTYKSTYFVMCVCISFTHDYEIVTKRKDTNTHTYTYIYYIQLPISYHNNSNKLARADVMYVHFLIAS